MSGSFFYLMCNDLQSVSMSGPKPGHRVNSQGRGTFRRQLGSVCVRVLPLCVCMCWFIRVCECRTCCGTGKSRACSQTGRPSGCAGLRGAGRTSRGPPSLLCSPNTTHAATEGNICSLSLRCSMAFKKNAHKY